MKLKYSVPKKIPYIEFNDGNKLIFGTLVENEKGFNTFVFSGKAITEYKLGSKSKKSKKKEQIYQISDSINFITDMKFTSIPKEVKGSKGSLSPIVLKFLKKALKELVIEDHFPRKNLDKLAEMIDNRFNSEVFTEDDSLDDDPELDEEDIAV